MKSLGTITIKTVIPEKLSRLSDIAYNFWWTWNFEAADLFKAIAPNLWDKLGANPVALLNRVSVQRLEALTADTAFMESYSMVVNKFDNYMNSSDTWFSRNYPDHSNDKIAYFSAEFGLNETLPVYSGGLGVLSGDHCKSASDLGLPFTAIGLFYRQGYFNQTINSDGVQETSYSTLNIDDLAMRPVCSNDGTRILIGVDLPERVVYAQLWQVNVGRIKLFLIDSDIPQNSEPDRQITARLYGGDGNTRIQQEILLGIGGIKALDVLGINASVYHMNEGHSAFLGFELIRNFMQKHNLSFAEAREAVASSSVFTIHTPVPAGIDVFSHDSMDYYFTKFREELGISREDFLALGYNSSNSSSFNMASLAMTLAAKRNGVSMLHGAVTRHMFSNMWPNVPIDEVPITHVTNGIHTLTWLSPKLKRLYNEYLDNKWESRISEAEVWNDIDRIPDERLWEEHLSLKSDMSQYISCSCHKHIERRTNSSTNTVNLTNTDSDILTIGFSRRFATYKRASLIFRDINRIKKLLNIKDMPVRLIFAGKAHPADRPGQDIIKFIGDVAKQEGFEGKVILLENYNMALARKLVQSVDIWLNNPRMPMEASGTSGQKACINGVLNLSILDGWWREGFNGKNGWAIGSDTVINDEYVQDNYDSQSLYDLLEKEVIPLYYDRNDKGIPVKWIKMMKESVKSLAWVYSTQRMVQEYTTRMYVPSMSRASIMAADGFKALRQLEQWKQSVYENWQQISIALSDTNKNNMDAFSGEELKLEAIVSLGGVKPEDVTVELYYVPADESENINLGNFVTMSCTGEQAPGIYSYTAAFTISTGGIYSYNLRVLPANKYLSDKFALRLVKWSNL